MCQTSWRFNDPISRERLICFRRHCLCRERPWHFRWLGVAVAGPVGLGDLFMRDHPAILGWKYGVDDPEGIDRFSHQPGYFACSAFTQATFCYGSPIHLTTQAKWRQRRDGLADWLVKDSPIGGGVFFYPEL